MAKKIAATFMLALLSVRCLLVLVVLSSVAFASDLAGGGALAEEPTSGEASGAQAVREEAAKHATVSFVDEDGDTNRIVVVAHKLRWCVGDQRPASCRALTALRLDLRAPCHFRIAVDEALESVMAEPPPGLRQRAVAMRLLHLARAKGIAVSGDALWALRGPPPTAAGSRAAEEEEDLAEQGRGVDDPPPPQPPFRFALPLLRAARGSTPDGAKAAVEGGDARDAAEQPTGVDGRQPTAQLEWPTGSQPPGWASWRNGSGACALIVERPEECTPCAFPPRCPATHKLLLGSPLHFGGQDKKPKWQLAFVVPRPQFTLLPSASTRPPRHHAVCYRPPVADESASETEQGRGPEVLVAGEIEYHQRPQVQFLAEDVGVGMRTFLNPGWHRDVRLTCAGCTSKSRLVLQPVLVNPHCRGRTQQSLETIATAVREGQLPASVGLKHRWDEHIASIVRSGGRLSAEDLAKPGWGFAHTRCPMPKRGPCERLAAEAPALVAEAAAAETATTTVLRFTFEGARHLEAQERQVFFHHRSAVCFYPDEHATSGWLVGFATVHMDGPDMQAFIGFVCFFGVALPLICLVTSLLHYNKYERCQQHVQQFRASLQRGQLARELGGRGRSLALGGGGGAPPLPVVERPPPPPQPRSLAVSAALAAAAARGGRGEREGDEDRRSGPRPTVHASRFAAAFASGLRPAPWQGGSAGLAPLLGGSPLL